MAEKSSSKPTRKKKVSSGGKSKSRRAVVKPELDADALREAILQEELAPDELTEEAEEFVEAIDAEHWGAEAGQDSESGERSADLIDGLGSLIGGVRSLSSSALKLARERTIDSAARIIQQSPEQLERMARAGRSLQDLRNVTGVSIEEVAGAIDLKNPDLLKSVEEGKAALPFEILLRLSSFYARNNPVPFVLKYARTYNPLIARTLEKIGIDRLVIEAEREIQFVQILRSRDASRKLTDDDFDRVLAFTEKAFDMALNFAADAEEQKDIKARAAENEESRG